jgi:hypothetical protein
LFQLDTGPGPGGDEQKAVKKMREFLEVNTTGGGHFLDDLGLRVVLYIVHANALTSRGLFFALLILGKIYDVQGVAGGLSKPIVWRCR